MSNNRKITHEKWVVEYSPGVLELRGPNKTHLFCITCNVKLNASSKFLINQHLSTAYHLKHLKKVYF